MSAARLASRPRIGSSTLPVSRSFRRTRRLARCSSKPSISATRAVNNVKPPETRQQCAPFARIVRTRACAPGERVMRREMSSSTMPTGSPFKSATRSRSAGSKAISPRMVRSVMAETSALKPRCAASSSMHSCSIMVESISARRSRFRRSRVETTAASTGTSASSSRRLERSAERPRASACGKAISAAIPSSSQAGEAALSTSFAQARKSSSERARLCGAQARTRTCGTMVSCKAFA